jgi:rhodanese-related sulfurtransferase
MKTNHILALLAVIGGVTAAFTSFSEKNELYPTWKFETERVQGKKIYYISAPHLADLLYEKDQYLELLDIRTLADYESYHIPSALALKTDEQVKGSKNDSYVVYGQDEDVDAIKHLEDVKGKVYVLKGGLESWKSLVLFPDFSQYKVRNREALEHILRRSKYFGGKPLNTQLLHIDQRQSSYREGC